MDNEKRFLVILDGQDPNDGYTLLKEGQVDTYLRYALEELHVRLRNIRLFEVTEYDIHIKGMTINEQ